MNLTALPAFSDNYIWMFDDGQHAVVVDPGEAAPVLAALAARRLLLAAILVTHHHADHVGGIDALRPHLRGPVYGPKRERIPQPCLPLVGGDHIDVLGVGLNVIDVPGHTSGHIAYFAPDGGDGTPTVFCGDTLFSGGCGRLFEGTPAQMFDSLARLAVLPGETRVCCAHEYTLSNLKFAQAVEPDNTDIGQYTDWCRAQRAAGLATLPSSIERERRINPFMRCGEAAVARSARDRDAAARGAHAVSAEATDPVAVLAALRLWKNDFR